MTRTTQWNPFREMEDLMEQFSRGLSRAPGRGVGQEGMTVADWTPAVDIREDEHEYQLHMDLPQVETADVQVTVENGVLTIRGERRALHESADEKAKWHRVERIHGSFARSFTLPETVREDSVDARFANGVLTVHLPKSQPQTPQARQIQIRSN